MQCHYVERMCENGKKVGRRNFQVAVLIKKCKLTRFAKRLSEARACGYDKDFIINTDSYACDYSTTMYQWTFL